MKVTPITSFKEAIDCLADFLDNEPQQGNHSFQGWWVQKEPSPDGKNRPGIRFSFTGTNYYWVRVLCALTFLGLSPTVNGYPIVDIEIGTKREARFLAAILTGYVKRGEVRDLLQELVTWTTDAKEKELVSTR